MEDDKNKIEDILNSFDATGGNRGVKDTSKDTSYYNNGSSTTNRTSNNKRQSEQTTTVETNSPVELLGQIPVREVTPYVPSKSITDMLKASKDRENELRKKNINQQEIERKRGRYEAWQNALRSISQLAGKGYAPVEKLDDSRVIDSFKKLDELKEANANIANDPYISWVQKAALQAELQDQARKIEARNDDIKQNYKNKETDAKSLNAYNLATKSVTKNTSEEKEGNSTSNTDFRSVGGSTSVGTENFSKVNYSHPIYSGSRFSKGFTLGSPDNPVPVFNDDPTKLMAILSETFKKIKDDPSNQPVDKDGKNYIIKIMNDDNYGYATISKEKAAEITDALATLSSFITGETDLSDDGKWNAVKEKLNQIDKLSGYTISDLYRKRNEALMRAYNSNVNTQRQQTQPVKQENSDDFQISNNKNGSRKMDW